MPFEMKWVIDRSNEAETTQKLRKNYAKIEEVKMRQIRYKFMEKELEEVKA